MSDVKARLAAAGWSDKTRGGYEIVEWLPDGVGGFVGIVRNGKALCCFGWSSEGGNVEVEEGESVWDLVPLPSPVAVVQDEQPVDKRNSGLYRKYNVSRVDGTDGPGGKHQHCRLFVLDVDHDKHAKPAIVAYAESCKRDFPVLSAELLQMAGESEDCGDGGKPFNDLPPSSEYLSAITGRAYRFTQAGSQKIKDFDLHCLLAAASELIAARKRINELEASCGKWLDKVGQLEEQLFLLREQSKCPPVQKLATSGPSITRPVPAVDAWVTPYESSRWRYRVSAIETVNGETRIISGTLSAYYDSDWLTGPSDRGPWRPIGEVR